MKPKSENIKSHHGTVSRADRQGLLGQRGCVLWFTGLSGSGKSTLACPRIALNDLLSLPLSSLLKVAHDLRKQR